MLETFKLLEGDIKDNVVSQLSAVSSQTINANDISVQVTAEGAIISFAHNKAFDNKAAARATVNALANKDISALFYEHEDTAENLYAKVSIYYPPEHIAPLLEEKNYRQALEKSFEKTPEEQIKQTVLAALKEATGNNRLGDDMVAVKPSKHGFALLFRDNQSFNIMIAAHALVNAVGKDVPGEPGGSTKASRIVFHCDPATLAEKLGKVPLSDIFEASFRSAPARGGAR